MLIVAILFSVFSYSLGNAFVENPDYDDYCGYVERPFLIEKSNCTYKSPTEEERITCKGDLEPRYDDSGCASNYECNTCRVELDEVQESFNLVIFLFMSILGLVAVISALIIKSKDEVVVWLTNGFLLGGLISLFVGTIVYFGDAPRFVRPIIMLIELVIVIYIAIKKGEKK